MTEESWRTLRYTWPDGNTRFISGTATARIADTVVSKILYQHPDRQEGQIKGVAKFNYNIKHDVYSLGACMLELLTWEPLLLPEPNSKNTFALSKS